MSALLCNTQKVSRGGAPDFTFSFEFFPPKSLALEAKLWAALSVLAPLNPAYVSVTYGAGGQTRERTRTIITRIQSIMGLPTAAHLTAVQASREEVDGIAADYQTHGVKHIVALRGDAPGQMGTAYRPGPDEYADAAQMVAGLRRVFSGKITVAAYPEPHKESRGLDADLAYLKAKVDAGADAILTQFFFDNAVFLRFRDAAVRAGITVPIHPGIWPVADMKTTRRIAKACNASIPDGFARHFDGLDDSPELLGNVATALGVAQCEDLLSEGVEHLHFYTLNRAELTRSICHLLGVRTDTSLTPAS